MPFVRYADAIEKTVEFLQEGTSLLEVALRGGVTHFHQCHGHARCTTCRVRVLDGSKNLGPRSGPESQIATERGWPEDIRLACQARVLGDVTVARMVLEEETAETIYPQAQEPPVPQERILAIMFCDLRNFTGFAAAHLPHDVVYVLNRFFREACDPVLENDGYIDKYLGDGFLAVFGLNHSDPAVFCLDALRAAARIQERIRALNVWLNETFNASFEFGVGLHCGPAVVGHTGHPLKMQLTVLGDTVNIASRAESGTKRTSSRILATSAFCKQVSSQVVPARFHRLKLTKAGRWDTLGEITVEGLRDAAVLVQIGFESIAPNATEFVQNFYRRLFVLAPELEPYFKHSDMDRVQTSFLEMIGGVVRKIHRFDELVPKLREMGIRHAGYGVKPEYYEFAATAFIETLAARMGPGMFPEMRAAWGQFFARITEVMSSVEPKVADALPVRSGRIKP